MWNHIIIPLITIPGLGAEEMDACQMLSSTKQACGEGMDRTLIWEAMLVGRGNSAQPSKGLN